MFNFSVTTVICPIEVLSTLNYTARVIREQSAGSFCFTIGQIPGRSIHFSNQIVNRFYLFLTT